MRLENSFRVDAPLDAAWNLLMDVPRVVPCMPGATLDEVVDESSWKATMQVRLGPIGLVFATDLTRDVVDEANRRVTLAARARETRNRGRASATIESSLAAVDGLTEVSVATDLSLSGPVAQYGRGMIEEVASQIVTGFARCLEAQLGESQEAAAEALAAQSRPVSGLSLFVAALLRRAKRLARTRSRRGSS